MQYFIREYYDRPVSKKEFLRHKDKEIETDYVSQKHLVDTKILTPWKIKIHEKGGLLKPIFYKGRRYFQKSEVLILLEKENKTLECTSSTKPL